LPGERELGPERQTVELKNRVIMAGALEDSLGAEALRKKITGRNWWDTSELWARNHANQPIRRVGGSRSPGLASGSQKKVLKRTDGKRGA